MNKKPSQSERLARILADRNWHTTEEIIRRCPCIVHSRIAELRRRGWEIEHERVAGPNDARHHRYRATRVPT